MFDSIGPYILVIINKNLTMGCVSSSVKHAVVEPLLKKPSLDLSVLQNFRPISKLSFMAKILEKVVFPFSRSLRVTSVTDELGYRQKDRSTLSVTKRAIGHWHVDFASGCILRPLGVRRNKLKGQDSRQAVRPKRTQTNSQSLIK